MSPMVNTRPSGTWDSTRTLELPWPPGGDIAPGAWFCAATGEAASNKAKTPAGSRYVMGSPVGWRECGGLLPEQPLAKHGQPPPGSRLFESRAILDILALRLRRLDREGL